MLSSRDWLCWVPTITVTPPPPSCPPFAIAVVVTRSSKGPEQSGITPFRSGIVPFRSGITPFRSGITPLHRRDDPITNRDNPNTPTTNHTRLGFPTRLLVTLTLRALFFPALCYILFARIATICHVVFCVAQVPVFGLKNSLNVASAGTVVLYEVLRQWSLAGRLAGNRGG